MLELVAANCKEDALADGEGAERATDAASLDRADALGERRLAALAWTMDQHRR